MPGYLLDEDSIARLAKMLRDYEQGTLFAPGQTDRDDSGESPVVHYVRCTSATPTSGLYPGVLLSYDAGTGVYTDVNTIKLLEINGIVPTANVRYFGRFAGYTGANDTVYAISATPPTTTTTTTTPAPTTTTTSTTTTTTTSTTTTTTSTTTSTTTTSTTPAPLSIAVVTGITCEDGVITPVYTTICIPGGYIC
jgi:hypothetical protein